MHQRRQEENENLHQRRWKESEIETEVGTENGLFFTGGNRKHKIGKAKGKQ